MDLWLTFDRKLSTTARDIDLHVHNISISVILLSYFLKKIIRLVRGRNLIGQKRGETNMIGGEDISFEIKNNNSDLSFFLKAHVLKKNNP